MYQFINVTSPSFLFIIHLGNEPTLGMVLRSDVSINIGHTVRRVFGVFGRTSPQKRGFPYLIIQF